MIDIPDIFLEWAKDEMSVEIFDNRSMADTMSSAIRNGIVIQSGHGDLIDRDKIKYDSWVIDEPSASKTSIKNTPVIVPKEGVNDK